MPHNLAQPTDERGDGHQMRLARAEAPEPRPPVLRTRRYSGAAKVAQRTGPGSDDKETSAMDVRSAEDITPVVEHNGTTPVWWLVPPQELRSATEGGFLELVSEWEIAPGGAVEEHSHPTHEFYYILAGKGIMQIADEKRPVKTGDLVYTPPDTTHSIWPDEPDVPLRGLAFAVGTPGQGAVDYS